MALIGSMRLKFSLWPQATKEGSMGGNTTVRFGMKPPVITRFNGFTYTELYVRSHLSKVGRRTFATAKQDGSCRRSETGSHQRDERIREERLEIAVRLLLHAILSDDLVCLRKVHCNATTWTSIRI